MSPSGEPALPSPPKALAKNSLEETLLTVFGHSEFRGAQKKIIEQVLAGRATFVLMPTGAGKSLCYQLPAVMSKGMAIVVSPLIALMKNQVDQLNERGICAHYLNSTLSRSEISKLRELALSGELKLLYVAPESLGKVENLDFLKKVKLSFLAIDEAHCISEWGHDFRPEYRRIRQIAQEIGPLPMIALTATATPKVRVDIIRNLGMEGEVTSFTSSFHRDNLHYEVRSKVASKKALITFLSERKGQSGIIYCLSRKKVQEIADLLTVNGIKAHPYHAGLDAPTRERNQDAFLSGKAEVIVATIAFGMGIDKPDVRFVVHYDAPKSLEGYYQETGRAGRDGQRADCLLFYSGADLMKLEKFNKDKSVSERDNAKLLLEEVRAYSETPACRTRYLLHYFGEKTTSNCGHCDNCKHPPQALKLVDEAVKILTTIRDHPGPLRVATMGYILAGEKTVEVGQEGYDELPIFGSGPEREGIEWRSLGRQLYVDGYLEPHADLPHGVRISQKGRDYLADPQVLLLKLPHRHPDEAQEDDDNNASEEPRYRDDDLLAELKALRETVAKKHNLPAHVVFEDASLEEMAVHYPTESEHLQRINGVGPGKAQKFGAPFLKHISAYVEAHNIEPPTDVLMKSTAARSKNKIQIIQQIDRKLDLDEIAQSQGKKLPELMEEIEQICFAGTKLDLNYYIEESIDEDKVEEILDYFHESASYNVEVALEELGEDFSEDEVRLVRLKFLSEVAN